MQRVAVTGRFLSDFTLRPSSICLSPIEKQFLTSQGATHIDHGFYLVLGCLECLFGCGNQFRSVPSDPCQAVENTYRHLALQG